ncbi:MFS transporter [Amycolatopsis magusensis]|uniref:MFS transporter n=1 Tax=Amycolatopsis magusensis TaxID=882444 RepID=UPI003C2EE95D
MSVTTDRPATAPDGPRNAGDGGRRDLRLFLVGQVASVFGTTLTSAAVSLIAVARLGAGAREMSLIVVAGTLPALLFGPLCGVLLDRVRRPRRALITADLVAAAAVAACGLAAAVDVLTVAWLAGLTVVLNSVGIVVESLYFSHLHALGVDDPRTARGKLQSSEMLSRSIANTVGAPIAAALGAALLFLADVFTYLISACCLMLLKAPDTRAPREDTGRPGVLREFRDGVGVIRRHPLLSAFTAYLFLSALATSGITTQRAVFLLDTVGLPVALYTLPAVVATAVGAAGALYAPRLLARGVPPRTVLLWGLPAAAVSTAVLPLAGGGTPLVLLAMVLSTALPLLFGAAVNIALVGVINDEIGDQYFARITTLLGSVSTLAATLGALLGGSAGTALGVRSGIWVCVGIDLFAAVVLVLVARRPAPEEVRP